MKIRLWQHGDVYKCRNIVSHFSESIPTQEIFSELITNNQLFIAEKDQDIIGFISYKTLWNESIFLQFLRVHPDFHRKWIGSQLIEHIEKIAKKKWAYEVFSTVLADNEPSEKLHEKLWYHEAGRIDFDSGKELVYLKVI